jgi:hypothetical protein
LHSVILLCLVINYKKSQISIVQKSSFQNTLSPACPPPRQFIFIDIYLKYVITIDGLKQQTLITVCRLPTKGSTHFRFPFSVYSIYIYMLKRAETAENIEICRYIFLHINILPMFQMENGSPGNSLIRLPFANRPNESLSFVCLFTKKETEVLCF